MDDRNCKKTDRIKKPRNPVARALRVQPNLKAQRLGDKRRKLKEKAERRENPERYL
jgi:hypothetical protein